MGEILKPRSDKREYKTLILPNSLQLLLISDPNTHKCAASMNVNVGYFHDPDHLPGLAHFLEHMLSYASEKYPTEQSCSKYISEHGGRKNAFTTSECTNYHFDVNADAFEEALDRFAQLFIKPLISPEATIREIKAVDSEYQKNLLSDRKRMNQLNKHLSSPAEPYHKFSTGSWETLEVHPKEKDIDIRDELIKFYEEYYSANLMHLVVYAKDNLDKVESLVQNKFQDIQNTNRNLLSFHGRPCKSEHLQILVKVVPIQEGHKLKIRWPITPGIRYYKDGPCRYIKHLIGHKAEGSLFYILKKLGWATGLSAGETDDWTVDYSFFQVAIDLTDAGHENMQNVVGLLFKYVQLLQNSGVCEWIFEELAAICETTFHYQDKSPQIEYVVEIAKNMKETALKRYQNYMFQQPWQQATYYCSLILQDHSWPWMEQLEVLPDLKAETLSKFVPLMLSKAFLECYIAGNIEQSEAESIIERIESTFFKCSNPLCRPLFPSQHQTKRVVKLEEGKSYCYSTKGLNPRLYSDDYLANVKLELIALVAKQPMFYQLRSVEQLGYIVFLSKRNIFGINGLQFVIQSTAKAPSHIDHRVEAFLRQFEGELHQLNESEFQKNVSSLIESKLEKHKNLREESTFYWREITDGTFKFDRKESEIAALKQLTLNELIDFFDEFVKVGATQKKTLSIRVYGSSHLSV